MVQPGRKARPPLAVIREGNPGHKKLNMGVRTPPHSLSEPNWNDTFVGSDVESARCRQVAATTWQRIVPVLERTAGLGNVDNDTLHDYCVCVARIDQCERTISREGLLIKGERGWQKNGATTIAGQYRSQLRTYIGELGLSPSARGRLPEIEEAGDSSGSPFDV